MPDQVPIWGVLAATLQIAGYVAYLRYFLKKSIRPNAASWLMFAYGTAFLAFLEYRQGASAGLLFLPVICAIMSIAVALMCLRRNYTDPLDRFEKVIFSADLWLTIIYAGLAFGVGTSFLPRQIVDVFLVAVNLTALTCFVPIVRSTWRVPTRELPMPWLIWAAAYGCLGIATWASVGFNQLTLFLYPAINFALHALVGVFALRKISVERVYLDKEQSIFLDKSQIHGVGVFSGKSFAKGDVIWKMSGRPKFHSSAKGEPNFVGIAPNVWIDPDPPIDTMNHSCKPNAGFAMDSELVALEDIEANTEITFDYSTTEADPEWNMFCACGAQSCREQLYSIQIAFANAEEAPPASPTMQEVWRAYRRRATRASAFPQFGNAGSDEKPKKEPEALKRQSKASPIKR